MAQAMRAPGGERWTVLDVGVLTIFVAVQVAAIITRVEKKFHNDWDLSWGSDKLWYEVTKSLGKTAALTILFLFLPICKSCFYLDLFNLRFERAVKFHRWLAWFLVFVVVVHAAAAVTSLALAGQFRNCMWPSDSCAKPGWFGTYLGLETSRAITYGWLAFLVAAPLVITSIPWFRRHHFEVFYYTHFLFVPAIVLVHLHYPAMIYYAAPGLAAYILDKVLWWCSSRRPIKIVSLTQPAPGFVRMKIALAPNHEYEPGAWIQINVPAVSLLEWHPMSVASAPGHSTITIDVKVIGDWTRRLQGLAARFDPSSPAHTTVFLDRFHGCSHLQMQGYLNHPAVLMFAGGIGVTPMLSGLRSLVECNMACLIKVRRVVLVWVVRKESVLNLYRNELAHYQSLGRTQCGCEIEVIVHATLSEREDSADFAAVNMPSTESMEQSTIGLPKRCPFTKHLKGYWHQLLLTLGAGGGYLLGIFTANVIALEKDWAPELVNVIQLGLATLFATILVLLGMWSTLCRDSPDWRGEEQQENSSSNPSSNENASPELNVAIGCRPDVEQIVGNMKEWCLLNDCSSVGVAVCGPDKLIEAVMKNCKEASSPSLPFVVDDETFEW
jgi:predicted ferric reductase